MSDDAGDRFISMNNPATGGSMTVAPDVYERLYVDMPCPSRDYIRGVIGEADSVVAYALGPDGPDRHLVVAERAEVDQLRRIVCSARGLGVYCMTCEDIGLDFYRGEEYLGCVGLLRGRTMRSSFWTGDAWFVGRGDLHLWLSECGVGRFNSMSKHWAIARRAIRRAYGKLAGRTTDSK